MGTKKRTDTLQEVSQENKNVPEEGLVLLDDDMFCIVCKKKELAPMAAYNLAMISIRGMVNVLPLLHNKNVASGLISDLYSVVNELKFNYDKKLKDNNK